MSSLGGASLISASLFATRFASLGSLFSVSPHHEELKCMLIGIFVVVLGHGAGKDGWRVCACETVAITNDAAGGILSRHCENWWSFISALNCKL